MVFNMKHATHKSTLARLSRIEGQVRGIARMVAEERYCIEILTQIQAVRAALRKVEDEVLGDHIEHCVEGAVASGDAADQRRKMDELVGLLAKRSS